MPRRPKWLDRPSKQAARSQELTPEQRAELARMDEEDAGRGVSPHLVDRAFWLDDDTSIEPWVTALDAVEKRGDKGPLLDLLRSEYDLPREARAYLADLLERRQLKKKRGGQSVPAYDRTDTEQRLTLAIEDVRRLRKSRVSVEAALDQVSKSHGIPLEVLATRYHGSRGSTRRMWKRRP
jgi:hypothetical protein